MKIEISNSKARRISTKLGHTVTIDLNGDIWGLVTMNMAN
jgi:hypothetical protein